MKAFGFDTEQVFAYENGFYLTTEQKRLQKLIAHYELYKMISTIPGSILELGVFKGSSLIRFASFRDMLETANSRKILGFDAFGRFPRPDHGTDADNKFIEKFESVAGEGIGKDELKQFLDHKRLHNIELMAGDIFETLPAYLKDNPQLRIALLHIDVDVYSPSKFALDLLFPHMVRGGLIIMDDYGTVEGETRAVDEFLAKHNLNIQKLSFCDIPSFIKV